MGIRKAQVFTIRISGLDQPLPLIGKPALRRKPHSGSHSLAVHTTILCLLVKLVEGPVRDAVEQIICMCIAMHGATTEQTKRRRVYSYAEAQAVISGTKIRQKIRTAKRFGDYFSD